MSMNDRQGNKSGDWSNNYCTNGWLQVHSQWLGKCILKSCRTDKVSEYHKWLLVTFGDYGFGSERSLRRGRRCRCYCTEYSAIKLNICQWELSQKSKTIIFDFKWDNLTKEDTNQKEGERIIQESQFSSGFLEAFKNHINWSPDRMPTSD